MSHPLTPGEIKETNPVGAQEVSPGSTPVIEVDKSSLKKAVTEAISDEFAVTDAWTPRPAVKFIINCPSGQKVLAKHLETRDLLRVNLIEEMDRFAKQLFPSSFDAQGHPIDRKEDESHSIWTLLREPEKRRTFFSMTNRLMMAASVRPKVVDDGVALRTNENGEQVEVFGYEIENIDEQIALFGKPVPVLKEGEVFAGVIDLADRLAFFTELNKPLEEIEPFREGSNAVLASMEPSQGPGVPTE